MSKQLKSEIVSGLFWRTLERLGRQVIGFGVSIILARILNPSDFGTFALITVFIGVASNLVEGGFWTALVQSKVVTQTDYCSTFYLSLVVAAVLYAVLYLVAPWIAAFYHEPVLVWVLRLLSLSLILGALNTTQNAVMTREMKFKLSFRASLITMGISGAVGIGMAYNGYGVWALVGSSLAGQIANTVALWLLFPWRPQFIFSFPAVRRLFGFGSKMLASGLLDALFNNIYNLIIGKLFNATILGYYSRGQSIPNVLMTTVQGTIANVIFPVLTSCQQDKPLMKRIVRRAITTSSFLIFPMMFGLAAIAKPLVLVLLTEKWMPCVPYLQLACITFAVWPLHVANLQAILAAGRSDLFLTLEVIKKVLVVVIILGTFKFGVMAMVIGQAVGGLVGVAINAWPNRRLIDYSLTQQIADVLPAMLLAAGMGVLVFSLTWLITNNVALLVAQGGLGVLIYFGAAALLKFDSLFYLWQTGRQYMFARVVARDRQV